MVSRLGRTTAKGKDGGAIAVGKKRGERKRRRADFLPQAAVGNGAEAGGGAVSVPFIAAPVFLTRHAYEQVAQAVDGRTPWACEGSRPHRQRQRCSRPMRSSHSAKGHGTPAVHFFRCYSPTKAPGPDGYPAHFFQKHWNMCGEEVSQMVLKILRGEDDLEVINKTFIVLIPKITNPSLLSQFRPISLCNVLYKIDLI